MRCLLVNPAYPDTYWSLRHMLPLVKRRWLVAPLPLITVAALLPRHWECRLVDLAVRPLADEDLAWADVAFVSGMLVQRESLHQVLARCRRAGLRSVVGGPYATAQPDALGEADHLVLGEAEDLMGRLAADLEAGRARPVYREGEKPDLRRSPVPRYDLLEPGAYHYLAVQFSRGCPFQCEFCDIITLYGRVPRTKTPKQVIAELEAIRTSGFRGRVMFVDDNFIGNKKAVRALLERLATWRRETGAEIDFFTEASIDLADRPELVDAMTDAGFAVVFVGIETPRRASLVETRKLQNLHGDLAAKVRSLRSRGLDVWAGFILGFDHDEPDVFDEMVEFVQRAGIAYAMVGMLIALPGTPLHRRLQAEGRLLPDEASGDMFAVTNVAPLMGHAALVDGYAHVLERLYEPETYFARCLEHLRHFEPAPGLARPAAWDELPVVARSLWRQGVRGGYRRAYWRFLARVLRRHPRKLPLALAQACAGHHFLRYTDETVLPALRRRARGPAAGYAPARARGQQKVSAR
jgi:radical SAM superfamily enzyme YgiQ (UPF0313 family)